MAGSQAGSRALAGILGLFVEKVGGQEGLAKNVAINFEKICDPESPHWNPKLAREFLAMILKAFGTADSNAIADDRLALTDDQITAELRKLAMDSIQFDPTFRREVFIAAVRVEPSLYDIVVADSSALIAVNEQYEAESGNIAPASAYNGDMREGGSLRLAVIDGQEVPDVGLALDGTFQEGDFREGDSQEGDEDDIGIGGGVVL